MHHYTLNIRGRVLNFYVYTPVHNSREKVAQLRPFFSRMPDQHLDVLYPIFVMEKKPGGRMGGGTWKPDEVRGSFLRPGQVRNTGIPAEDIERLVLSASSGMIGLSRDRWERVVNRLKFSVFHEIGHCVDYSYPPHGLIPSGASQADFAGMETNRCGGGNHMARRAVEAYARAICSPVRIFHTLPPGTSAAHANQRLLNALRRAPAFRTVRSDWPNLPSETAELSPPVIQGPGIVDPWTNETSPEILDPWELA